MSNQSYFRIALWKVNARALQPGDVVIYDPLEPISDSPTYRAAKHAYARWLYHEAVRKDSAIDLWRARENFHNAARDHVRYLESLRHD